MSISTAFDMHDEVNRLFDIEDDEKLTENEVTNLFTYFNNTDNLSSVKKALIKSKPNKNKLRYLRNLLISGMSLKIENVFEFAVFALSYISNNTEYLLN